MIEVVAETGSTSADLAARLAGGAPAAEGDWLVADRQVAGRGRQGRAWNDGAGNFMGSTIVALRADDPPAHTLSLTAGVALFAAVEQVARGIPELALKWPNDVLLGGAKLAGILLERFGDHVVVGIGVNIAHAPQLADRATASLAQAGYRVERDEFAAALEASWAGALRLWHDRGWAQLRQQWIVRAHPVGTPLSVHAADASLERGTFAGIDLEGALQLKLPDGTRRTIHAGEIQLDRR